MRPLLVTLFVVTCSPLFATALAVDLVPGTTYGVPYNYTGNGNGFSMGAFEINNPHTATLVLDDITLAAIGSGDDSTAFSEVGLFLDSNASGSYDPGVDTRYGAAYTAYPVNDGSLTFTSSIGFAPSETKRFIIVGKMNGAVIPTLPAGFRTIVSSISATGTSPTGVPTPFNEGVSVFNAPTSLALEYEIAGAAPPYSYSFRVVLDNHDGSWVSGQAWDGPHFGQAPFGFGGTVPFASWVLDNASLPVGPYTTGSWGNITVSGVSYNAPGLFDNVAPYDDWIPSGIGDQLIWWGTANVVLDEGEMAWSMHRTGGPTVRGSANLEPAKRVGDWLRVDAVGSAAVAAGPLETGGGNCFAIGAFDALSHDSASTLGSITIAASGTGDDSNAFSEIGLFVDSNTNGVFDPGVDQRFGQVYSAYPTNDGTLTFYDSLAFAVAETRTILIVAKLDGPALAGQGQTFDTSIVSVSTVATGGPHAGMPTAVIPGINIVPTGMIVRRGASTVANTGTDGLGGATVGVPQPVTYTIINNGAATLDLTGSALVSVTAGASSSSVSVTTQPAASIAPGGSTSFTVVFTAAGPGAFDFTVSIDNTDPVNNPYTWTASGTAPSPPGNGGGDQGGEEGCSTGDSAGFGWLALSGLLVLLGWRLRLRH